MSHASFILSEEGHFKLHNGKVNLATREACKSDLGSMAKQNDIKER